MGPLCRRNIGMFRRYTGGGDCSVVCPILPKKIEKNEMKYEVKQNGQLQTTCMHKIGKKPETHSHSHKSIILRTHKRHLADSA